MTLRQYKTLLLPLMLALVDCGASVPTTPEQMPMKDSQQQRPDGLANVHSEQASVPTTSIQRPGTVPLPVYPAQNKRLSSEDSKAEPSSESELIGDGCYASFCMSDSDCPCLSALTAKCDTDGMCAYTYPTRGGGGRGGAGCPGAVCMDDSDCFCKSAKSWYCDTRGSCVYN
jgi:hypothetical protein